MPRGDAQRPAGLFWPDGQYRLARPGPCGLTLDRGDGAGGNACAYPARDQRAEANAETRGVERHRRQGVGLRDFLSKSRVGGDAMNKPSPVNPPELRSTFVAASSMPWQRTEFDGIEM